VVENSINAEPMIGIGLT